MSSRILFISLVLCLSACTEKPNVTMKQANKTETPIVESPIVGGDKDEHGCIGSAGYSWSIVKNECIQIFNSGIRLDPQAAHLEKTMSAFAVFKSDTDDAQAEIFLPNEQKSVILTKVGKENAGEWKNDIYVLKQYKGMYMLEDNKKTLLYQGSAVK